MKPLPDIKLRAMEPEDLDVLYQIENDRSLWETGATNVPYSRYALRDYIAHAASDIYVDRQVRLVMENTEGQVVGLADLANFDPCHLRAELGLVVLPAYRRQRYAEAAVHFRCSTMRSTRSISISSTWSLTGATRPPCKSSGSTSLWRAAHSKSGSSMVSAIMMPVFSKEFYNFSWKKFCGVEKCQYLCTR